MLARRRTVEGLFEGNHKKKYKKALMLKHSKHLVTWRHTKVVGKIKKVTGAFNK